LRDADVNEDREVEAVQKEIVEAESGSSKAAAPLSTAPKRSYNVCLGKKGIFLGP